jgi:hypothetical protein
MIRKLLSTVSLAGVILMGASARAQPYLEKHNTRIAVLRCTGRSS